MSVWTLPTRTRIELRAVVRERRQELDARDGDRVLAYGEPRTYRRALAQAAKAAGISRQVLPKHLRDTFASQLLSAGMPLAWVSRQLGHASIATTARHYARWVGDDLAAPPSLGHGEVPTDLLARISYVADGRRAGIPGPAGPGPATAPLPAPARSSRCHRVHS